MYDPKVLDALIEVQRSHATTEGEIRKLKVSELIIGMVILDPVEDTSGRLLVAGGQEVTVGLAERLRNFASNAGVKEPIRVLTRPT